MGLDNALVQKLIDVEGLDFSIKTLIRTGNGILFAADYYAPSQRRPPIRMWRDGKWRVIGITDGQVNAFAFDEDTRRLFAGGTFSTIGGKSCSYLAMWDEAREEWQSLATVNGPVQTLAIDLNSHLYVGGRFTVVGVVACNRVARWNGSKWFPLHDYEGDSETSVGVDSDQNSGVNCICVDTTSNAVCIGGEFSRAGGKEAHNIAMWDGMNGWQPLAQGVDGPVGALAHDARDGSLYVAGAFSAASGVPANNVAVWRAGGWEPLGEGLPGQVAALVYRVKSNKLYAGGGFHSNETGINYIAKWQDDQWQAVDSGVNGEVQALASDETSLFAGGNFTTASSPAIVSAYIGRYCDVAGGPSDIGWQTGFPYRGVRGYVSAIALDHDNNLYIGGEISLVADKIVSGVAMWDGDRWSDVGGGVSDQVLALAIDKDNHLYVAGRFSSAGGHDINSVAKWDGTGWVALGEGIDNYVYALAYDEDEDVLYAGGNFFEAGGSRVRNIARWHDSNWSTLGDGIHGGFNNVGALALHEGALFVGGNFTLTGDKESNCIAVWHDEQWFAIDGLGEPGDNTDVNSIVFDADGGLYIGGKRLLLDGTLCFMVKRDAGRWISVGEGEHGTVNALAYALGNVYVGGGIDDLGNGISRFAKLNGSEWGALGDVIDGDSNVRELLFDGRTGVLYVAVAGRWSSNILKLSVSYSEPT